MHIGYEDNVIAQLNPGGISKTNITIMGQKPVVAETNGKIDFGPQEKIFYGEFDGKRRERLLVKIIGE